MKRPVLIFLVLAACGPLSVAEAERQCLERARLAERPRGEVSVGMTSNGKAAAGLDVTISSDYIMGRDPSAVFDSCVVGRSGEMPSRPLSQQPGWK